MKKRGLEHVKIQKQGKARDYYVCQICGSKDHVEGHHIIDYQYGGAANTENIIALCRDCHKKTHRGKIDLILC